MALDEDFDVRWTRKHDKPGDFFAAPRVVYARSLADLCEICKTHPRDQRLHAAGSHWGLSTATLSDHTFIETHDPANRRRAMGRTLYDVIPNCMTDGFLDAMARHSAPRNPGEHDSRTTLVHVEAGKRVYQLYAELDQNAEEDPQGLARFLETTRGTNAYHGSWAFRTLGGAGGQTVFGALTTGTHGGDFKEPPIADDVVAMHLVADGGSHYWIERPEFPEGFPLTDDDKLMQVYGDLPGFNIKRDDDDLFRAVLVAAGRFGVVYSLVLRAVPQYLLHEDRRLDTWQNVRGQIPHVRGSLYASQPGQAPVLDPSDEQCFLQIVVSLAPIGNFTTNMAAITRRARERWMSGDPAPGRDRRVGAKEVDFDPLIGGPRFKLAGNSFPYDPDETDPSVAVGGTFLERACANGDFLEGVIETAIQELTDLVEHHTIAAGGGVAAVVVVAGAGTVAALLAALVPIIALLAAFLEALHAAGHGKRFGQVMNDLQKPLLDPAAGDAGVFAWQVVCAIGFKKEQRPWNFRALSYAVMDSHDYHDLSCNVNADSIEVFFDATDPMLLAFVDAVVAFEARQERVGRAAIGYAALRFTSNTAALLGPARWTHTCVVEVAVLKDAAGSTPLIDYAIILARSPTFSGILHWGQRNECTADEIALRFGDPTNPDTDFGRWRLALDKITGDGEWNGFSSVFTRQTGLEP